MVLGVHFRDRPPPVNWLEGLKMPFSSEDWENLATGIAWVGGGGPQSPLAAVVSPDPEGQEAVLRALSGTYDPELEAMMRIPMVPTPNPVPPP